MSIVRNSVLDGNGLTTDLSSSVVVWTNVVVSGVTYTFCEYITTTETGNPTYIRDVPHLGIVRPTGHDYYPCHNGATYGVYDKITHTFTPKTVTGYGEEDKPYGVGIYDLMWATATGYTDLLTLCAVDGGIADVIENNPLHPTQSPLEIIETRTVGGSSTTRVIKCAFNIKDMPLPSSKTVIENSVSVTYTYAWGYIPAVGANGDLIHGRNPSWKIWADGSPINIRGNIGTGKWLIPNILVNDEVNLKWWDGYNNNKVYPPFLSSSSDTWEIEYHNGVYLRCNNQLRTAEGDKAHPNPTKQLWLYDTTTTNFPSIRMGIGNLPNWDGPSKGTMKVDIFAFMAAVQLPTAEVDVPLYIVKTLPFWADGTQALTNSTSGKFSSSTPASIKEKAKEGKSGGNYYDFTTGGVIISKEVSNALYPMLQRNSGLVNTEQELVLYTTLDAGDSHTETSNLVKPSAFSITKKDEGASNYFRLALKTPTLSIGGTTYTIINGVYATGGGLTDSDSSQFVFSTSVVYTKSGIGMTFLCEKSDHSIESNDNINCICVMELTVCDSDKNVIGYEVYSKKNSKGIYYFKNTTNDADPDVEYRNSPFTYISDPTTFDPPVLAQAKKTNGSAAYPGYDQYVDPSLLEEWEKTHTMKVAWWYGQNANEIPSTLLDIDGAVTRLKPNSTAVIGMYVANALIPGFNTATNAAWVESGTGKGGSYNPSVGMFFTGFRGWEFNLHENSHKIFVFPYDNVVYNDSYSEVYFKRYKPIKVGSVLDHYITDSSSIPNASINNVGEANLAHYVMLFEFTDNAGVVSRAGGAFLYDSQLDCWKLVSDDGTHSNNISGVTWVAPGNNVYNIDAYLDYIPDSTVNDKFFEVPQGLLGINSTLTTHGLFRLRIQTRGMSLLGTLRWSIQDV